MEDRAIDMKFDTKVDDIGQLTTDQLATECNGIYQQMEVVGTIGLMMATEIGRRLITVKDRLPHGSFENWCSDNLNFSKRKAERMMLIAKKADDENSILAKTPTLSDLSISKAFAILSAPEDIAAEVVETSDVDDMTVRELQEQIDKLKEEKKEAEEKADWAQTQEKELARLRAEADKLRKDAKLANDSTMLEFKFQANAFQTQFNEILKTIGEAELEASEKMATAFKELLTKLSAKI